MSPKPRNVPRVLRLITSIDPEVGGPSYHLVNAAVAEARTGTATVVVACTTAPGRPAPPGAAVLEREGVRFVGFPRPRVAEELALRWGLSARLALWILLRARRFDVLHVDYVWSMSTLVAIVAGRLWRRPVVLTPHESLTDFGIGTSRSGLRRRQKLVVRRLLLAGVAKTVVSSNLELRDSQLDPSRSTVVSHPIDGGSGTGAATRRSPREPDAPFVVGFLGRLHPKKRVEALIAAVHELPRSVRLVVGGDQPRARWEELRTEIAQAGDADRVDLVGFVAGDDREAFFARLDVLVMPSAYECFGMSAAEAMTAGVPVVVSDHCGVADTVERYGAGVVVPLDEPDALTRTLRRLADDPTAVATMAAATQAATAAEFSFAAYGRAIGDVYAGVDAVQVPRLRRMVAPALRRRAAQATKLARLLRVPAYRHALRSGVAAAVEHDDTALPDDFRTVLDVGANRGQFGLVAARRWPQAALVCFEPLDGPRGKLEQVLAGHPSLRVVDAALSEEAGTAEFHLSNADDSSSLLPITDAQVAAFPGTQEAGTQQVRTARLDAELAGAPLARPVLLKMDVQGAELGALRGATGILDQVDVVLVECSFVELYAGQALAADVIRFLDEQGFAVSDVGDPTRDADGRTLQTDMVFRRRGADAS